MIVIGDIHGCYKSLMALIAKLPKDEQIVLTGDLIDRGPDSKSVVQYVIDNKIHSVKGNHEQMLHDFMILQEDIYLNEVNGGLETINSYNGDTELLKQHTEFLNNLPLYLEFKDCKDKEGNHLVVSHAMMGKLYEWSEERKQQEALLFERTIMWNRYTPHYVKGIYNIHGHTPLYEAKVKTFYANVDTGCAYKAKLTGLQFPEMIIYEQEYIG